jgi:hypothetical protein
LGVAPYWRGPQCHRFGGTCHPHFLGSWTRGATSTPCKNPEIRALTALSIVWSAARHATVTFSDACNLHFSVYRLRMIIRLNAANLLAVAKAGSTQPWTNTS